MVNTLPAEIENRELAEIFDLDTAYSTSVTTTQHRPGQRHYEISKDQLTAWNTCTPFFCSWQKIADMLQVSVSTIQQRQGEFRLNDEFE